MDTASTAYTGSFEQLLEAMPDAMVIVDAGGRIVLVNRQAESVSGYPREQLLGMAVEELVPEGLRAGHVRNRASYGASPTVRAMGGHLDIRFRRRDGTEFPADIALSPVTTDQGLFVVASIRDITERKRTEAELLHAQERFRLVVEGVRDYAIFMLDPEGNISSWSPAATRLNGYEAEEIIGRHLSVFYPEADVDEGKPARELREAIATGRHEEEGWRLRKDGSRFWASVVTTAIRDPAGGLLGFAKITRDVTERKRQDDRLRAVLEVAQATLEGRGEKELLCLVAERSRTLVNADLGMVTLVEPGDGTVVVVAADGVKASEILGHRAPHAGSITAAVLASRRGLLLDDAAGAAPGSAPVIAATRVGPVLAAPLASGRREIGAIGVSNEPGGRRFAATDQGLLELFAAQAAVALAYIRVREDLQRLAVFEDRERIGRELHDGAIQALFAVGMGLQGMATMTADTALRDRLQTTVDQIDEVIRDLRNYIFGLRPGLAADRHLGQALQELAQQFEERHGVACAVDVDQAVAARLAARSADIVQVAREALSNVGRHSGAATCRLTLRAEAELALLAVEDDGRGFEAAESRGHGWGLRNLRERAAAMRGSLEVSSVAGEGTTVQLRVPL